MALSQFPTKSQGFHLDSGQPCIGSWISSEGKYGFVEFRTSQEAGLALGLQDIEHQGHLLKYGRPKQYQEAEGEMNNSLAEK